MYVSKPNEMNRYQFRKKVIFWLALIWITLFCNIVFASEWVPREPESKLKTTFETIYDMIYKIKLAQYKIEWVNTIESYASYYSKVYRENTVTHDDLLNYLTEKTGGNS